MRFFKINSIVINLEDVCAITTSSDPKKVSFTFHLRTGENIISSTFKKEEAEEILAQIMENAK